MATAMDLAPSTYAAKEDPAKFKKPIMPLDFVKKVADVLSPHGVDPIEVMQLAGITGDLAKKRDAPGEEWLEVGGTVAAGVWRETAEDFAIFRIEVPAIMPNVKRFGLVVEGFSMDAYYEPGTVLDCISIFNKNGIAPETGDHVIVERTKPDGLREITVKEMIKRDGRFFLMPRSSKPEFQTEIEIGSPTKGFIGDERVEVIGFVVGAIAPPSLRLLERFGKVKRDIMDVG